MRKTPRAAAEWVEEQMLPVFELGDFADVKKQEG